MRAWWFCVTLCGLVLSGCASYPKSSAVTSFSDAATTASALLQSAGAADFALAQKTGFEEGATAYLVGANEFKYPPRDYPLLDKVRIAARTDLLKAIAGYAQALAALQDPQQAAKVGDALAKLGSSVANFATVAAPDADSSRIAPVVGIISSGAAFFVSQRNAYLIRETAEAAHPLIVKSADLLAKDFDILERRFERRLDGIRAIQKQKLVYIRQDASISRIELEKRYKDLVDADQILAGQVVALHQSKNILAALVEAHDELRSSDDTARAIGEFKNFVDALALNLAELKKT